MTLSLIISLIFFLILVNYVLAKFNISLDKQTIGEKHKSLLRENEKTPLSGTFYFLPIFVIIFYNFESEFLVSFTLLFLLGLFADLKFISSYKLRLIFQFLFITSFLIMSRDLKVDTRILFINNLMNFEITRIFICTFFFMVLINGFNLIDGTNCLCTLNFLIISIFLYLLINELNVNLIRDEIEILITVLSIFLLFNFFGKNFLGDGATYGIGFLLGFFLLKISIINENISPYFIANLLWYPAFENLFTIIRRGFSKNDNFLPDNKHLHQLIFKFLKTKFFFRKKFITSSLVGILINTVLIINYFIGFRYIGSSLIQIMLISNITILYLASYYFFSRKYN